MGAQVLLLPLLFVFICATFIVLHTFYQKWKLKEIMKKKREAAKISLVNIMQLTNSTLISPAWLGNNNSNAQGDSDLPPYSQLKTNYGWNARNPNVLSSVVTLREEQDSPPPYEDLYNFNGKPQSPRCHCGDETVPTDSNQNQSQIPNMSQAVMASNSHPRSCTEAPQNTCLLHVSQQQKTESDPSMERRNSSAVLYL